MSDIKKINRGLWMSSFAWLILLVVSLALGFYLGMQYRMSALDGFSDRAVCNFEKVDDEEVEEISFVMLSDKEIGEAFNHAIYVQSFGEVDSALYSNALLWQNNLIYLDYIWLGAKENLSDIVIKKYDFDTKENRVLVSLKDIDEEFIASDYDWGKKVWMSIVNDQLLFSATDALDGGHAVYWIDPYIVDLSQELVNELDLPVDDGVLYRHHYGLFEYENKYYLYEIQAEMMESDADAVLWEYNMDDNVVSSDFIKIPLKWNSGDGDKEIGYEPVYEESDLDKDFVDSFYENSLTSQSVGYLEKLSEYIDVGFFE